MLRYKSIDSVIASAKTDLHIYADNNLVNDRSLIKVVREVNTDLGLRIHDTKDCVLEVINYKATLPQNFVKGISLFMIFEELAGMLSGGIHGTNTREYTREELINKGIPITTNGCLSECGGCSWVTRTYSQKELVYDKIVPVKLTNNAIKKFCDGSPAIRFNSESQYQVDISSETLYTNVPNGTIYMSYVTDMIDSDGGILVLDHPLTDPYYEWAVKVKILEDLYYNSEADVERKLQDARINKLSSRGQALSLVIRDEINNINNYTDKKLKTFYNQYVRFYV
jgi:hypothetical protein